ncbi:hypothetical protein QYE76_012696 [Lolium multiflorum]|uniref:F-box domain-containing protein n=1 Tax=Lolium multiflorum TaxID=4521 RepID=A0AAD8U2A8_LOLMU|nr:hypothetical protein QYE76_012696 [Lolium multiflorum]
MKNNKGSRRSRNKATAPHEVSGEAGGDRLSKLPEDILVNILERVDTLDAIRTCILSKPMLQLPTMLSLFDLNIASLARHHDVASHGFNTAHVARYNNVVAGVAEKVLSARNLEIPIQKLTGRFYFRREECFSIGRAFARTMETQKVDEVEFTLITEKSVGRCSHDDLLCYAKLFNTWLGDWPVVFAGLTRLWLCNMRFSEQDISNMLSTCKRLRNLRLAYSDAGVGSVLQVEHDELVELSIEHGEFEAVQLKCVPKLQRVNYTGWSYPYPNLTFGYVPQLSRLSLILMGISFNKNLHLSHLLVNVPSRISDLHLDFKSEKIWVVPECPKLLAPVLCKLRVANLVNLPEGCDIAWTMFIVEAAPALKEMCIRVWDHWCTMVTDKEFREKNGYCEKANVEWQPSAIDFKHKNLVKLTICGFQPDEYFLQYVRRILEVAVNMEEISLHDREACERCGHLDPNIKVSPSRYPQTGEEKNTLRDEITKELRMISPGVIRFEP